MFTGLIREFGEVANFAHGTMTLRAAYKPQIGDSVSVNGACLTVVSVGEGSFDVELGDESAGLLALENYSGRVHIEPAMRLGERLDGHLVQGHCDGVGLIKSITKGQNSTDLIITLPAPIAKLCAPKGSIAVDGVSLTINDVSGCDVRLTIINHTMQTTLLGGYKVGRRVNIESDMIARIVARLVGPDEAEEERRRIDRIMAIY
jgi:riboflavin synthase